MTRIIQLQLNIIPREAEELLSSVLKYKNSTDTKYILPNFFFSKCSRDQIVKYEMESKTR